MKNIKKGGIRRELILALSGIIILSGFISYIGVLLGFRYTFDKLVQQNDIDIATGFAGELSGIYGKTESWADIVYEIDSLKSTADVRTETGRKLHAGMPLVVTDSRGITVYPSEQSGKKQYQTKDGVPVVRNGQTVGNVFFKSMLRRNYNPHERLLFFSMAVYLGVSVLVGIILAVTAGSVFANRFVRPVESLEKAVRSIADGQTGIRAKHETNGKNEINLLAENFNVMAEKLEQTENARKVLLADMAHELRTPVSIIQANIEMMLNGIYPCDKNRLQTLYDETGILTGLIANLRTISDLESGSVPARIEPLSILLVMQKLEEKYRPLFERQNIVLSIHDIPDILILSDEDRLRQVLRNVLMNALKYAGEYTQVSIHPTIQENMLQLVIADEGPGVPENDIEKIFQRFYRVDPSRSRDSGGRGLGLAICRQFMESCHGSITARNRTPHGLEICLIIPLVQNMV